MQTFYGIEVHFLPDIGSTMRIALSALYELPPDRPEVEQQVNAWRKRIDTLLDQGKTLWTVERVIKVRIIEYHLQPTPIERYRQELETAIAADDQQLSSLKSPGVQELAMHGS